MLGEISKKEKDKNLMVSLIHGTLEKKNNKETDQNPKQILKYQKGRGRVGSKRMGGL